MRQLTFSLLLWICRVFDAAARVVEGARRRLDPIWSEPDVVCSKRTELAATAPARFGARIVVHRCAVAYRALHEVAIWIVPLSLQNVLVRLEHAHRQVNRLLLNHNAPPTDALRLTTSLTSKMQFQKSLAELILRRYPDSTVDRQQLGTRIEEIALLFEDLAYRLAHLRPDACSATGEPTREPVSSNASRSVAPTKALVRIDEPLGARLEQATADLKQIDQSAQLLIGLAFATDVESLVVDTRHLLDFLARNGAHATIARSYLVVSLPGLRRTLDVAVRTTGHAIVTPDLDALDASIATMRRELDSVVIRLQRAAQESFDLEHDVWRGQMDERAG